jgi:hypothetical protein
VDVFKRREKRKQDPGVDVMITIVWNIWRFFQKKNNVMVKFLHNLALS